MKNLLIATILLSLVPGTVRAATTYETCMKEEKVLKTREVDDCRGLKYLLNPSGCFATRKKVKEFAGGACAEIIRAGKPETVAEPSPPQKMGVATPVAPPTPTSIESPTKAVTQTAVTTEPVAAHIPATLEQLKEENARLKAEIGRLTIENKKLRNGQ